MTTRRMAYWWFRFVVSGRFLEKFLNSRHAERTESTIRKSMPSGCDPMGGNRFSLEPNAKRFPADHAQNKKRESLIQPR
jgi:hypothetical protein